MITQFEAEHLRAMATCKPPLSSLAKKGLINGDGITAAGREVLAEYDRKWVMVERKNLEVAVRLARLYLDDLESAFSTKAAYENEIAESVTALDALAHSCTGEQPNPDPPAEWIDPVGNKWVRGLDRGAVVMINPVYASVFWMSEGRWTVHGNGSSYIPTLRMAELATQAHAILWPELHESKS